MSTPHYWFTDTPAGLAAPCFVFGFPRGNPRIAAALVGLLLLSMPVAAAANEEEARIDEAITALEEIMDAPDAAIPEVILERSVAIAVFPSTVRAGFFVGGSAAAASSPPGTKKPATGRRRRS